MNLTVWEANRRAWHVYQKVRLQRASSRSALLPPPVGVLTVDLVGKVGYVITQTTPKQFNEEVLMDVFYNPVVHNSDISTDNKTDHNAQHLRTNIVINYRQH